MMDEPWRRWTCGANIKILPYLEKVTTQLEILVLYVSHARRSSPGWPTIAQCCWDHQG